MAVIEINRTPSPRDLRWFGLLLPVFFALVGALVWRRTGSPMGAYVLWTGGALLGGLFACWPASRRRIYVAWMYAVFPIGWTISHLLLAGIYFLILTPIGLMLRLAGRDPIDRRLDRNRSSYWVEHQPADRAKRYLRQF